MKNLFLLSLLLSGFFGQAQYIAIPDPNFEQALIFKGIDSGAIDGKVLTANVSGITSLDVTKQNITDLTGIEGFLALTYLDCWDNQISSLDLTKNTALTHLWCFNNQITSLDVTKNTVLIDLLCFKNQINNLDVTENTALTFLNCSSNQISSLDVTKNTALTVLSCDANQISSLDVTKNTALTILGCSSNQISSLDVTKNRALTILDCGNNSLTFLNLKNGNNNSITRFGSKSNPNLACIQVDNKAYSDSYWSTYKDATSIFSENCSTDTAPIITAKGYQIYCPQTHQKIVTRVNIVDPINTSTNAISIQISTGYVNGQDALTLANPLSHPTITTSWDINAGKLKLYSPTGVPISYLDFIAAIKDVEFNNSSASPSGTRNFSITLGTGLLSYLPSNGHYYEYVASSGINWTKARDEAATKSCYGIKGYLATLTAADEAQLAGAQASGTGWIGGSDAETEGVWKWVTGPEAGTTFWNGKQNGTTTAPFNYANWNSPNEPNDSRNNEDYAHITSSAVGNPGTWNDLPEQGDPPGNYYPQGYIVEYGGMPGDPILQISASTTITIPKITSTTPDSRCDTGTLTLQATATDGVVYWYDSPTAITPIATGNSFITPILSSDTIFYVDAGCISERKPIKATIDTTPTITSTTPAKRCDTGTVTLEATASAGTINWYDVPTGGTSLGTGASFTTPYITSTTTYYVDATTTGCPSQRLPVEATVYPVLKMNEEVILCQTETATLDASISGMSYLWSPNGETTQTIVVSSIGDYSVIISSPLANCDSKKDFKVIEHPKPIINAIIVNENAISIQLENPETYYEFSIDGELFKDSNQFSRIPSGQYTAYIREKNLCNLIQQAFTIFTIDKYFTPNNDGHNDLWEIKEMRDYPNSKVEIFNRYGKLLKQLNSGSLGWNGKFNGIDLPADDYWYVLKMEDSKPEIKGHFSLKR